MKNLLKKSKSDGRKRFLLKFVGVSSPLENGKSSAELLYGRKIRSNLPVVEQFLTQIGFSNDKKQKSVQKMKQKKYFDKNVRELPHLKKGDCVRLRDVSDKKWDAKVVVKEQVAPRSYVVETPDGVHYRRNRKDLLKTEENISGELDLEMNSNETETVSTQLLLNNSDTEKVPGEVPTPIVQL